MGYWILVLVGAVDLDSLDISSLGADGLLEGGADGLLEGGADGLLEGGADGVLEGGAEGAAEGIELSDGELDGLAGRFALFNLLRLGEVPLTITVTVLVIWTWLFSGLSMQFLGERAGDGWTRVAIGTAVLVGAGFLGLVATSLCTYPLRGMATGTDARTRASLVGKRCTIRTGRVDADFGQADLSDGGDHLTISVRCLKPNELTRGSVAIVFEYDSERQAFLVVPDDTP